MGHCRYSKEVSLKEARLSAWPSIVITSYTRTVHLANLLDSIAESRYARDLNIYIFLDGQGRLSDRLYIDSRSMQKAILQSFDSVFKSLHVIERPENLGSAGNADTAIENLFNKGHESLIVLEDDIEISPVFFEFIKTWHNVALHTKNAYILSGMCSFFRSKRLHLRFEGSVALTSVSSLHAYVVYKRKYIRPGFVSFSNKLHLSQVFLRLLLDAPNLLLFVVDMKYLGKTYGDVLITLRCHYLDQINIYPVNPLILPKGYDRSGENCLATDKYNEFETVSGFSKTHNHKCCEPLPSNLLRDYLRQEFGLGWKEYAHLLKRLAIITTRSARRFFS